MSRKRNRRKKQLRKKLGFLASLEHYSYKRIAQAHIPWIPVAIAGIAIVIGASIAAGYFQTSPLFGTRQDVMKWAAGNGDYQTAQKIYLGLSETYMNTQVLGAGTDLEEIVYPEKRIERELHNSLELLQIYPGDRDLLLHVAELYTETGDAEQAQIYWNQARLLDPNNPVFGN